jgi:hypothetical protein
MSGSDSNFYHDDPVDFDESPRKRKSTSILALLALFVGAGFYVQTTLASNVSLNNGAPVEFGQGVSQLTSCTGDSILTLTPTSTFVNASSAGSFYFNSVTVSGIPATSRQYDFTINAYGNTDQAPLSIFNTNSKNAVINNNAGTFSPGAGSIGMSISSGSGTFTATFTNPVALATSVFKVVIQCGAPGAVAATDWVSRSSSSVDQWGSIAYGNGTYVAVGYDGGVMTSTNGISWTTRNTGISNRSWSSITYGEGIFVAISWGEIADGQAGIMTSPDGITWTSINSPAQESWSGIAYGNSTFVVVSYQNGNKVMTSPDGVTWTLQTSAANNDWRGITYGNGMFVAVSATGSGNRIMTSTNGISWTQQTSAADNDWTAVAYGSGKFVAVSSTGSGNRVMTSPDGVAWTIQTSAADNDWSGITYGNGMFVAVSASGSGNRVMTSADGITWALQASAADNNWYGVTYGNGIFVAVSVNGTGNQVMTRSGS